MAKKKNCTLDEECEGGRHAVLVLNVGIDSTFSIKTVSGVLLIFDISLHMIHHICYILSRVPYYKIDALLGMHRKSLF